MNNLSHHLSLMDDSTIQVELGNRELEYIVLLLRREKRSLKGSITYTKGRWRNSSVDMSAEEYRVFRIEELLSKLCTSHPY